MMHVLRVGAGSEALRTRCLLLLRLLRDKLFAADGHAEQPPCGERPHERAGVRVVRLKRVGDEQVGRVDDHEIIAVEYLGER